MWFPQNPKVLVVDDEPSEIDPLLKLFSQNGIPYVHFDGKEDSYPEKPFSSIRLVILDIDLEGRTSGLDDKTKASVLATYLSQLITTKDSLYAILFWTKRKEIIDNVIEYLSQDNGEPVVWKDMEKPAKADLNLEYVRKKFFSNLQDDVFEYLIKWEECISNDASLFTNEMSSLAKQNAINNKSDWTASMKSIFSKLACSYNGTSKISSDEKDKALKYATYILNQSFSESLSVVDINFPSVELPETPDISLTSVAQLNSILFIEKCDDSKIENGKVFFNTENHDILELLKKKILSKVGFEDCNCQLVSVVLTPSCDLAHKKYLYKDEPKIEFHRILSGIKIEIGDNADYERYFNYAASACSKKKKIEEFQLSTSQKMELQKCISCNRPENLYETQPFIDNEGKICVIIFHFGTIQTIEINPANISFSYLMKNSLISDLQTKLANHVNRLGNSMLEFKQ